MTGASIARHSAWARGMWTPERASSSAGSTRRSHCESPVAPPELSEAGRHSGHRAGGDAHLVVDDLVPERDADVLERRDGAVGMTTGDRDEEVEETRLAARCVVPDRVPSAGKPCHDRFGHAGGERGCDSRVRGGPALLENAQTRFGSGRMACCNPWRQKHVC